MTQRCGMTYLRYMYHVVGETKTMNSIEYCGIAPLIHFCVTSSITPRCQDCPRSGVASLRGSAKPSKPSLTMSTDPIARGVLEIGKNPICNLGASRNELLQLFLNCAQGHPQTVCFQWCFMMFHEVLLSHETYCWPPQTLKPQSLFFHNLWRMIYHVIQLQ